MEFYYIVPSQGDCFSFLVDVCNNPTNISKWEETELCNELWTINAIMQDCEHTLELDRSPELLISPKSVVQGAM